VYIYKVKQSLTKTKIMIVTYNSKDLDKMTLSQLRTLRNDLFNSYTEVKDKYDNYTIKVGL